MLEPLNLSCLSQPHWLVIARGLKTEEWFRDNQAVGTGGILMPTPQGLRVGQRYFRFASSTSSYEAQFGGGWWLDFENYKLIKDFAIANGHSLKYSARLFLALPYSWTRVDRLISAILEVPLVAYAGKGNPVKEGRESWTPVQHLPVCQLYVPGLYKEGRKREEQLFHKAFPKPSVETSF